MYPEHDISLRQHSKVNIQLLATKKKQKQHGDMTEKLLKAMLSQNKTLKTAIDMGITGSVLGKIMATTLLSLIN